MDTQNKAARLGAAKNYTRQNYNQTIASVQRAIWLLSYRLEEARQDHAAAGHSLRHIGCCIALAMLRFMGRRA